MKRWLDWMVSERPGGDPGWLTIIKVDLFIAGAFLALALLFGAMRLLAGL